MSARVVTLIGAKGGVGTTRAVLRLARRTRRGVSVVLVDLDLAHGDLAQRMGVSAATSVADLCSVGNGGVSAEQVAAVSYRDVRGRHVVPSPVSAELGELVTPALVFELLAQLRRQFDVVIIDAGSRLDAIVLAAAHGSDEVRVVVSRRPSVHERGMSVVQLLSRAGCDGVVRMDVPGSGFKRRMRKLTWTGALVPRFGSQ